MMNELMVPVYVIACAWVLDAAIGDPESFPHPVRFIGKMIEVLELWSRRSIANPKIAGIMTGSLVPCASFLFTYLLIRAGALTGYFTAMVLSIIVIYTCLSTRCLGNEALLILQKLRSGDMEGSRTSLSRIVGRDTEGLNQKEIIRATIESVSENTVDGIIAPMFFAFLGGAPLAMAYKATNTLDSMVGYKNDRYRSFGWFSARLDDVLNFIPARLSMILIAGATLFICPGRTGKVLKTALRDAGNSPSPNAGFPEASFAGALGIQLGGDCTYNGNITVKPVLGDKEREHDIEDILKSVYLMWATSFIGLAVFSVCSIVIRIFFT